MRKARTTGACLAIWVANCLNTAKGFVVCPALTPRVSPAADSSHVTVEAERSGIVAAWTSLWTKPTAPPVISVEALDLQAQLRRLCGEQSTAGRESRIEELAKELNALNPTKEPARSPLLAGKWRLLHSTVPGPSSGRLGPFVADVYQDVRPAEKKILNILELGPPWALRGALEADVEVLDGSNWAIAFDVVYNTFAGLRVQEKYFDAQETERRIWNMTYLDENFRILYGRRASQASAEGFIFVMDRAEES